MHTIFKYLGAAALAASIAFAPTASFAGVFIDVGISVNTAPPILPVYVQPPCPQPNLIWTPGYWAYSDYSGYYWVPGAWVAAPEVGYLWTPGYWGYNDGLYAWNPGYWGPHVGFYGGVNYGFGYFGVGFLGGGWAGNRFRYNTAYANVNRTVINNVYVNKTVINNYNTSNRVSFNGGARGIQARPNAQQLAYRGEAHVPATPYQQQHIQAASQNRMAFARVNHGHPAETQAASRAPLGARTTQSYARPATATQNGKVDPFSRFTRTSTGAQGAARTTSTYARPSYATHAQARTTTTYNRPAASYSRPSTYSRPATSTHPAATYSRSTTYSHPAYSRPATASRPQGNYGGQHAMHASGAPRGGGGAPHGGGGAPHGGGGGDHDRH